VAKKRFYLVKRSDRLTEGKPTFYVRFRSEEGEFLPWRSTGKTTKTLAENWALQRLGQLPTKESLTFGAYAADWWTESCAYCEGRVARGVPITAGYRRVRRLWLDKYVLPRFKAVLLTKLSARMVEEWLLKLRKGSLSATTVNHVLRTLKIMTREAVRLGYLNTDPTASVRQLRETPEERGILTPQEIRQLFDEDNLEKAWAGDLRHFTLNMVAASCGLRLGEVLGLSNQYIHPDHLEVRQAWNQIGGLQPPKWQKPRLVPLPGRTSAALQEVIEQSPYREPTDLLFYGQTRDRPIAHRVVSERFYAALAAIGINDQQRRERRLCFHSHRHGFNSYCRGKVPDELLRVVVGHQDGRMTEKYFHPGLEAIKELAKVQEALLPAIKEGSKEGK